MPRLKIRKLLLSLVFLIVAVIILTQIQLSFLNEYSSFEYNADSLNATRKYMLTPRPADQVRINGNFWKHRMWFFKNGTKRPNVTSYEDQPKLIYSQLDDQAQNHRNSDRIVSQLNYVPPDFNTSRIRTILIDNGIGSWGTLPLGRKVFKKQSNCPVDTCTLVVDKKKYRQTADAVLFKHFISSGYLNKPQNQIWILYLLESPKNTPDYKTLKPNVIDWTASYRQNSDIVTPYEKFQLYDEEDPRRIAAEAQNSVRNWAKNKTKKVAWFVSNCFPQYRLEYAKELAKYIQVDIYGVCGTHTCPRGSANECFEMLNRDYKFYLAFENSHCKDYITEKFFLNGLSNVVIPIVMGAKPKDYEKQAPPMSYIHVENFESPKELANYLHILDKDNSQYNKYFQWKGTGEFINTHFWCRLCAMLHAPFDHLPSTSHSNIQKWWRSSDVCFQKDQLHKTRKLIDSEVINE